MGKMNVEIINHKEHQLGDLMSTSDGPHLDSIEANDFITDLSAKEDMDHVATDPVRTSSSIMTRIPEWNTTFVSLCRLHFDALRENISAER